MNTEKSRSVFKKKVEKFKNLILQDCNADELEFPELESDDYPSVGDEITIDDKTKETGERLMPNGVTIKFNDGVVTEIIEPEEPKNLIKTTKDSLKRKIQIMGPNKSMPFFKGNSILVDKKEMIMAKVQLDDLLVTVFRGKISKVERMKNR